jgi:hypothetical protein
MCISVSLDNFKLLMIFLAVASGIIGLMAVGGKHQTSTNDRTDWDKEILISFSVMGVSTVLAIVSHCLGKRPTTPLTSSQVRPPIPMDQIASRL